MKKLALGIMAIAITIASVAQNGKNKGNNGHRGHKAKKEFKHKEKQHNDDHDHNRAFNNANLSDAQRNQHKVINENFRSAMKNLQSDNSLSKEVKQQRKQALIADHRAQIQATLTPEQRQQWGEKKKAHGKKGQGRKDD